MSTPYLKSLAQVNAFGNTVGVEGPLSQGENLSVSAAGSNVVAVVSNNQWVLPSDTIFVSAATGAGTYTSIVALSAANHLAGDKVKALVTFASASANATVVFRNASATGTILLTIANAGATIRTVAASFEFNGIAWVAAGAAVVPSSIA